ncbi:hypothetical protein Tco_0593412 [Tanacetum coccineum]
MDTLSLVSEYLKDLEECMDDGDSEVAKEEKLFDALEHKSVVIEADNQKIAIFTKALLRAFGEPFMRKMVNDVNVEIHGVKFKADFVVLICYWGEPSIMSGRDFNLLSCLEETFWRQLKAKSISDWERYG